MIHDDWKVDMTRRSRTFAILAAPCVLVLLVVLGWTLAVPVRHRWRARRLSRELEMRVAIARDARTNRPILRAPSLRGNAADAARDAVLTLGPMTPVNHINAVLRGGDALPPEVVALLHASEPSLRALRNATHLDSAHWTIDYSRGADRPAFHWPLDVQAAKLLLAQATASPPGECLQICADTVRFAGDLAPQNDLVPLMIADVIVGIAAPVALRCAARASADERAQAAREFDVLATSAPSFGEAFWTDAVVAAANLRAQYRTIPWFPRTMADVAAIRGQSMLLDAWEYLLRETARPIDISASEYPEAFAALQDLMRRRTTSTNPVIAVSGGFMRYVHRDAEAQAQLRAVALALAYLATVPSVGPMPPSLPPELAERRALRDPFSGRPLRWRSEPDGARATIYSLGINGVDDSAEEHSDDIALTVSL